MYRGKKYASSEIAQAVKNVHDDAPWSEIVTSEDCQPKCPSLPSISDMLSSVPLPSVDGLKDLAAAGGEGEGVDALKGAAMGAISSAIGVDPNSLGFDPSSLGIDAKCAAKVLCPGPMLVAELAGYECCVPEDKEEEDDEDEEEEEPEEEEPEDDDENDGVIDKDGKKAKKDKGLLKKKSAKKGEKKTKKTLSPQEMFELRHKGFKVEDLLPKDPEPRFYSYDGSAHPENIPGGKIEHKKRLPATKRDFKKKKADGEEEAAAEEEPEEEEDDDEKIDLVKKIPIEEDKDARIERVKAFQELVTRNAEMDADKFHQIPEIIDGMNEEILAQISLAELVGLPCSTSDIKLEGNIEVSIVKDKTSGVVRLHFSSAEGQMMIKGSESFTLSQTVFKKFVDTCCNRNETKETTDTSKFDFDYESRFEYVNQYCVLPVHDHVIDAMCYKTAGAEIKATAKSTGYNFVAETSNLFGCAVLFPCLDPCYMCHCDECVCCTPAEPKPCCPKCCECGIQCPSCACPSCNCNCACGECPNCCDPCCFCKSECCRPCYLTCFLCVPCYKCCALNCPPCLHCFKSCHALLCCRPCQGRITCNDFCNNCCFFCNGDRWTSSEGFDKENIWDFEASQVIGKKEGDEGGKYKKKINGVKFDISTAFKETSVIVVHYRSVLDGKTRRLDMKTDASKTTYVQSKKFVLALAQHRAIWDTTARGAWDAVEPRPVNVKYNFRDHLPKVEAASHNSFSLW